MAKYVQKHGSQLFVVIEELRYTAQPTNNRDYWIISGVTSVDPPPPSGGDYSWPYGLNWVTSEYRTPERPTHNGMDFSGGPANGGKPIPSIGAGTVWLAQPGYFGYGNAVIIDHGRLADGNNWKSLYGHMQDPGPMVSKGQTVTKGQTLGLIGNTGRSFGNHLHLETWRNGDNTAAAINPRAFFEAFGDDGVIYP